MKKFTYDDFNHFLLGKNPWKKDLTTASHYFVGALVAAIVGWLLIDKEPISVPIPMFCASFAVGYLIETLDKNFDWSDVIDYMVAGQIVAIGTFVYLIA